jgi:hypothetical protein
MKIYILNILKLILVTVILVYLGQALNNASQQHGTTKDEDDFFTLSTPAAIHFLNKDSRHGLKCIRENKHMTGRTVIEIPALQITGVTGNHSIGGDRATAL